ncbi:MAG: Phage tail fibers [uncultured Cytophagales bacterium]|uniref:Phage tail fibers n=1 Tax=uncultured Cytophagales bacterium TaxID=158755 RepID=A0A6J4IWX3_9SPHI|nr:MAG: Phage tail fibers [uncultured Cytophagales bacterium]
MKRKFNFPGALRSMAVVFLAGLAAPNAAAQWTTSGTNIYNANTGNVGIGTTTPGTKLDVNGPVRFRFGLSIAEGITFDGNKAIVSAPASPNLTIGANAGTLALRGNSVNILSGEFGNVNITGGNASSGTVGADVNINAGLGATPGNILLSTNGAGNVGIGTTTPAVKLQVNGGNVGQVSSGNLGDPTAKWSALGQPPTAFPTGGAYYGLFNNWAQQNFITGLLDNGTKKDGVIAWQDQTSASPTTGTSLRIGFIKGFGTGGANPAVFSEKVTILANGNLGVGTTTPVYRVELPNIAGVDGQGRANAWITYSSGRWKDNVKTLEKASDKIMALRGVEYDWKKENGGTHALGFVAEEAGKVLPEAVNWEADGKTALGMNYDAVIPVLVEAFKELSREKDAEIKALKERLAQLEKAVPGARIGADQKAASPETSAVLRQNRPNPFHEKTLIEYELPAATRQAALFIYNLQGEQLKRFDIADKRSKSVELDGNVLPAGLYLYSLVVDGKVTDTKQMILTK